METISEKLSLNFTSFSFNDQYTHHLQIYIETIVLKRRVAFFYRLAATKLFTCAQKHYNYGDNKIASNFILPSLAFYFLRFIFPASVILKRVFGKNFFFLLISTYYLKLKD